MRPGNNPWLPTHAVATGAAILAIVVSSCSAGPGLTPREIATRETSAVAGQPTPEVDPSPAEPSAIREFYAASFDDPTTIDNPWFPFSPGMHWVYEGITVDGDERLEHRIEFSVTDLTKEIGGVRARVAWIVDFTEGELAEKEIAFYAQASDGTVWYLGEHPEEFEEGEFVDAPTWIHGIDGAVAGIAMPAEPEIGMPSFSEGWAPEVEFDDRGQITEIIDRLCVLGRCYPGLVVLVESSPAEPDAFQIKYYSRDIGNVAVRWRGSDPSGEELDLVTIDKLDDRGLAQIRARALALEAHAYQISQDVYGQTQPMMRGTQP